MRKRYNQNCPTARTLDIIGDRWTLLIIRDLFFGRSRFNQLLASSPGMPPKVLSSRLRHLKEHGLVERRMYQQYPPRAEYALTDRGRSLLPVMLEIGRWGLTNLFDGEPELRVEVARVIYEHVPAARDSLEQGGLLDGATA